MSKPLNIWCVGRNYRDHAKELNNPVPSSPLIFLKAGSCWSNTTEIHLPRWSNDIHHECEIAIKINDLGQPTHVGLALDLTARDAQAEAKKKGEPWTRAKSFTGSCPVSPMIPWDRVENFADLELELKINDKTVQHGFAKDMIFDLETLISSIKSTYPICDGDLILTGTPAGVGPLKSGDRLEGRLSHFLQMSWFIA